MSLRGQREYIHALFEVPHDNPPRHALLITAYLDESQQESVNGHVVVSGFCGTEEQWKSCAAEWSTVLGKRKLHMKKLRWNRKNSEKTIRDLLAKLGPIPYHCGLVPVFAIAKVSDYLDLIQDDLRMEQSIKGYRLCLGVIFSIMQVRYPGHEEINFVCEQQTKYERSAQALLTTFQRSSSALQPYLCSLKFVRKDETLLTQPADFLAFAMAKRADSPRGKKAEWSKPIYAGHVQRHSSSGWSTKDGKISGWVMTREQARKTMLEIIQERGKNARELEMMWQRILSGR